MLAAVLHLVCHLFVPISHTTGEGTWHILLTCKNDVLSPEQGWDIMSVPMQGVDRNDIRLSITISFSSLLVLLTIDGNNQAFVSPTVKLNITYTCYQSSLWYSISTVNQA
jgi:hypothetical protein